MYPERRREGNPPRYLLVKMKDISKKRTLLEKAGKIFRKRSQDGQMNHPFRNVYISHDLREDKRARQYDLRQEKRRRTEAGEQNLIIRGGEIVVRPVASRTGITAASAARSGDGQSQ